MSDDQPTSAAPVVAVGCLTDLNRDRFWSKVDKSGECWLWTAAQNHHGYGTFYVDRPTKHRAAHRVAYADRYGPIPPGAQIDHTCYQRTCVRPEHLRLATPRLNAENRQGATSRSKTGVRGVVWDARRNAYVVNVGSRGKKYYGGGYADIKDAERAAIALRNQLHENNLADRGVIE